MSKEEECEAKASIKWVASLGEVMSGSENRFRLMIPRPEVMLEYRGPGVKCILLTLLNQWPEIF